MKNKKAQKIKETEGIYFRLNIAEKEKLQRMADESERTVCGLVRFIIRQEISPNSGGTVEKKNK